MRKKLKEKIGIVGYGYVGEAMKKFFATHYNVVVYDPKFFHDTKFSVTSTQEVANCDVGVVCVPTLQDPETGRCTTEIVEEVVGWLKTPLIIIKSTVEPGTTDKLREKYPEKHIVFSPEYCGESSYWTPYPWHTQVVETPFFIFGGAPEDTKKAVELYFPITGPVKKYVQTGAKEAELAKYMENVFYATKIVFCYEMASIIERSGADYNAVREIWLNDPRINPMHTAVFAQNNAPYSGKCLPKDLRALVSYARDILGYDAKLLEEVNSSNDRIGEQRKERRNEGITDCPCVEHSHHDACQPDREA